MKKLIKFASYNFVTIWRFTAIYLRYVPVRKWSQDRKWSRTTNDPQIGPQMIPDRKWSPYWPANDPDQRIRNDMDGRIGWIGNCRTWIPNILLAVSKCPAAGHLDTASKILVFRYGNFLSTLFYHPCHSLFFDRDHLRANMGIISGPGSFAVRDHLRTRTDAFMQRFLSMARHFQWFLYTCISQAHISFRFVVLMANC